MKEEEKSDMSLIRLDCKSSSGFPHIRELNRLHINIFPMTASEFTSEFNQTNYVSMVHCI